jgi:hypothetical protein
MSGNQEPKAVEFTQEAVDAGPEVWKGGSGNRARGVTKNGVTVQPETWKGSDSRVRGVEKGVTVMQEVQKDCYGN